MAGRGKTGLKKKIMAVFGTRPEAIKMCPLIRELQNRPAFQTIVTVSGQHRQMLDPVLRAFSVAPDYDLSVMREKQTLADLTAGILSGLRGVLEEERPELLLVHGDTATTFAAALAGFYVHIPVGHVEAGLRTYDMVNPFPEEFNRRAVTLLSRWHFAPTLGAKKNLLREGVAEDKIYVTGNTVIDALKTTVSPDYRHPELLWAAGSRLILLTAHRRENWGEPLRRIFRALRRVLEENPDVKVIYPIHQNPEVRKIAAEELGGCERVHLIEPLGMADFHNFMAQSYLILTDSGGIQEEAPSLGKPVLVLRETTERPEGVEAGTLLLVGREEESVYQSLLRLLNDPHLYRSMARAVNPYGDGRAGERIADILEKETGARAKFSETKV